MAMRNLGAWWCLRVTEVIQCVCVCRAPGQTRRCQRWARSWPSSCVVWPTMRLAPKPRKKRKKKREGKQTDRADFVMGAETNQNQTMLPIWASPYSGCVLVQREVCVIMSPGSQIKKKKKEREKKNVPPPRRAHCGIHGHTGGESEALKTRSDMGTCAGDFSFLTPNAGFETQNAPHIYRI